MLEVFDLSLKKTAILQNAFDIVETEELNAVGSLRFSLPADDAKTEACCPLRYVRYNMGQMYRILTPAPSEDNIGVITYQCEHVIATLIDDVLFGAHTVGNLGVYTSMSIEYILNRQTIHNWVLDECDFERQFEYGWENENLLAALFSIPNRFVELYMWVFDTSVYPWKASLKRIDETDSPGYYIRANRNFLHADGVQECAELCTRLYCLGYGEGVNQLTIKSVNNGIPYIQSPPDLIERYGIISRIWVDRRFEDAESLLARGQVLLKQYQEPRMSRTISVADLYELTHDTIDKPEVGKIAMLQDGAKTYITKVVRYLDQPGACDVTFATAPADIVSSISDLADRQRIEQVYSQGATNLYAQSVQANASPADGAVMRFYLPEELRIVNKVKARITLAPFRSFSRATSGGGASTATSAAGGGSTATSTSGGGGTQTSSSGGGTQTTTSTDAEKSRTSSNGGGGAVTSASNISVLRSTGGAIQGGNTHYHSMSGQTFQHTHDVSIPAHSHSVTVPAHAHTVSVPAHAHSVSTPSHTHSVSIPSHSHSVSIPSHTHGIEQGIFKFGSPTGATIYIDGVVKATMEMDTEIDLTGLLVNENGVIPRGQFISIDVRPNDLAYITIDLFMQGFVQSRGGATY